VNWTVNASLNPSFSVSGTWGSAGGDEWAVTSPQSSTSIIAGTHPGLASPPAGSWIGDPVETSKIADQQTRFLISGNTDPGGNVIPAANPDAGETGRKVVYYEVKVKWSRLYQCDPEPEP
jgi:hypothetical protein